MRTHYIKLAPASSFVRLFVLLGGFALILVILILFYPYAAHLRRNETSLTRLINKGVISTQQTVNLNGNSELPLKHKVAPRKISLSRSIKTLKEKVQILTVLCDYEPATTLDIDGDWSEAINQVQDFDTSKVERLSLVDIRFDKTLGDRFPNLKYLEMGLNVNGPFRIDESKKSYFDFAAVKNKQKIISLECSSSNLLNFQAVQEFVNLNTLRLVTSYPISTKKISFPKNIREILLHSSGSFDFDSIQNCGQLNDLDIECHDILGQTQDFQLSNLDRISIEQKNKNLNHFSKPPNLAGLIEHIHLKNMKFQDVQFLKRTTADHLSLDQIQSESWKDLATVKVKKSIQIRNCSAMKQENLPNLNFSVASLNLDTPFSPTFDLAKVGNPARIESITLQKTKNLSSIRSFVNLARITLTKQKLKDNELGYIRGLQSAPKLVLTNSSQISEKMMNLLLRRNILEFLEFND